MHRTLMRSGVASAGIVVACLVLAACSSNTPSSSSTTTGTSAPGTSATVPGTTTIPFNLKYNARSDVTTTGCTEVLGAWKLTGTVKSTFADTRNYEIVVVYITQPGDTVLDTKVVHVNGVGPGKSADWSATGAAGQKNLACVIRNAQAFPA